MEEPERTVRGGSVAALLLLLIGHAVGHLPTCLLALSRLGRRGFGRDKVRYRVENVVDLDNGQEVFGPGGTVALHAPEPFQPPPVDDVRCVTVSFLSPTQFRENGAVVRSIPFDLLVRNLLRRLSLLANFHAGFDPELDYSGLIEHARAVAIVEHRLERGGLTRYSSRQRRSIAMDGLTGTVTYAGPITPYMPLLAFGERFHVGHGTSLGMGQMAVRPASGNSDGLAR